MKKISISKIISICCTILLIFLALAAIGILTGVLHLPGHSPSADNKVPAESSAPQSSSQADQSTASPSPTLVPKYAHLADALDKLLHKEGIHAATKAELKLKGHLIRGNRTIVANTDILNAFEPDRMQMNLQTTTTSGKKTEHTAAIYDKGWYCLQDAKGKLTRTKRTGESTLSSILLALDILRDASGELEKVRITKKAGETIYQFSLSPELATQYFNQFVEQAAMNTKELQSVHGEVSTFQMTCHLDADGLLKEQSASIRGKLSKSIFAIPAELQETTVFTVPKQLPSIPSPRLKDYKIVKRQGA